MLTVWAFPHRGSGGQKNFGRFREVDLVHTTFQQNLFCPPVDILSSPSAVPAPYYTPVNRHKISNTTPDVFSAICRPLSALGYECMELLYCHCRQYIQQPVAECMEVDPSTGSTTMLLQLKSIYCCPGCFFC
jgi:hypothetical protein